MMPTGEVSAANAVPWTVTGQQETTIIGATGGAQEVMQVTFQLPDGTTGTVNVPLTAYTPDNVRKMIAAKAAVMHTINNLSA